MGAGCSIGQTQFPGLHQLHKSLCPALLTALLETLAQAFLTSLAQALLKTLF